MNKKNIKKIIEVNNLNKKFKNFVLFDDLNLTVRNGEKIALCGSNGSGKTTLIEIILGITKYNSGTINLNLKNEDVGIQFQDTIFPEGLTTKEIMVIFNQINDKKVSKEDIKNFLKDFEMESFWNKSAHSLSGGQKQKLNVMLAIIQNPKLLILDEVSTGLDITTKNSILKFLIKKINDNNSSLILVSHDAEEITSLCDRFVFIHNKKIIYDKKIDKLLKEFKTIRKAFEEIPKFY